MLLLYRIENQQQCTHEEVAVVYHAVPVESDCSNFGISYLSAVVLEQLGIALSTVVNTHHFIYYSVSFQLPCLFDLWFEWSLGVVL